MRFPASRLLRVAIIVLLGWVGAAAGAGAQERPLFSGLPPVQPDPTLSLKTSAEDWHKDAIVYHLWVAAFRDSDNSGFGDLAGITQSLDTLKALGVNCLWLSPFFASSSSPRNLHG